MKLSTLRLRVGCATLLLLLLHAAGARAQGWHWAQSWPETCLISAVATDQAGNTVLAGTFEGTLALDGLSISSNASSSDIFVARLNPAGQVLQLVGGGGPFVEEVSAVTVDAAGIISVAGNFTGPYTQFGAISLANSNISSGTGYGNRSWDMYVAQLNPAGTWVRAVRAGGIGEEKLTAMVPDPGTGQLVVAGELQSVTPVSFGSTTLSRQAMFLAWLDATGTWTRVVTNDAGATTPAALDVDAGGNVTVSGVFTGGGTSFGGLTLVNSRPGGGSVPDIFVARATRTGTWTQATQAGGVSYEAVRAMKVDASGNVILTGTFHTNAQGTVQFGSTTLSNSGGADIYVAWLSAAGVWTQAVRIGGNGDDMPMGLETGPGGSLIVGGRFDGFSISFGTGAPIPNTNPDNTYSGDVFVAWLSSAGVLTQFVRPISPSIENMSVMGAAGQGLVIAGRYTAPLQFGATTLTPDPASGRGDVFVAQLAAQVTAAAGPRAAAFGLAPNPARHAVTLHWPQGAASAAPVLVLDALGRVVRQQPVAPHSTAVQLDLLGLPAGLYSVRCGTATSKLLVE